MDARGRGPIGLGERLFRVVLFLLPSGFRIAYRREIIAFQKERLQEVGPGPAARGLFWADAIRDVVIGALLEWGRSLKQMVGWGVGRSRRSSPVGGGGGRPGGSQRSQRPGMPTAVESLLQDLRFGIRSLLRARGFTFTAVLSLGLGIGVFSAVFSLFLQIWMKPVPGVPDPDRVVELLTVRPGTAFESMAYPDFIDLRETDTPLLGFAGWKERTGSLVDADGGESVRLMYVSANYFEILGVAPRLGRTFLPAEDLGPGQHPVAVLSYKMWQDRLGADPEILGRTLILNRTPYTVVGVAPQDFNGHRILVDGPEVWLPLMQFPWVAAGDVWTEDRDALWLRVLGRLRENVTLEEANAAIRTVFSRLEGMYPESNENRSARAYAFGPVPAQGRTDSTVAVYAVFSLLSLVLLIICANVAGMVLARSVTREQELAVRMALGSGRRRLARLLMVEALLLSFAGVGLGVLLGVWGMDLVYASIPGFPPLEFAVEAPVLGLGLLLGFGATLAVGLLPAFRFSRPELVSSLKDDSGGGGRRVSRIHRFAASAQAGVALTLLVTCGLFLRSLGVMEDRDFGFEPQGLVTTRVDLFQEGYESQESAEVFLDRAREAIEAVPGVISVSVADGIPLDLSGNFTGVARADQPDDARGRIQVELTKVTEHFFETVGSPVLQGRGIEYGDNLSSDPVVVITESLAARLWPGEDALGRTLRSGGTRTGPRDYTVVGIVADVASSRPTENWPNIFLSFRQTYGPRMMFVLKTAGDLSALARPIQSALLSVDPGLSYPVLLTSESLVERGTQGQRLSAGMAGGLGVLALLLSAIGVYGVVAFAVTSRTREIGLRMAMGASRRKVLREVLLDALRLAVPGLAVGALLAGLVAAAARAELLGLSPADPISFLGGGAILFLVVLAASLIPARAASGIDPMEALKGE